LQTDNGNEFTNKSVQELLEEYSITHRLCQADDKKCMGIAERFNRTLKAMLNKYMEQNDTSRWIDVLDKVIANYNSSYHSAIKMKPKDVDFNKMKEIMVNRQDKNTKAKAIVEKASIKVGDRVRLPVKKGIFAKEGKTFSDEVFIVEKINTKSVKIKGSDTRYPIDKLLRVDGIESGPKRLDIGKPTQTEAKKEAKVTRLVEQREGLDRANITENKRIRKAPERLRF
ncbi:MAG: hypothetical protein RL675_696, partial [Bacteroidota bacterium]